MSANRQEPLQPSEEDGASQPVRGPGDLFRPESREAQVVHAAHRGPEHPHRQRAPRETHSAVRPALLAVVEAIGL